MITWHPPEILVSFGPLPIRTYGALLGLAIGLGLAWGNARARRFGINPKLADDVFFWAALGGLLGARLGFVAQDLPRYFAHPAEIIMIWTGGLSFHGALAGGLAAGWLVLRRAGKLNLFWNLADSAAAPVLLGAILGRFGNWANQELYGYPTRVPWSIAIDPVHRLPGYEQFASFHPTFAYEALLNLVGLLILLLIEFKRQKAKGKIAGQNLKLAPGSSFLFMIAWYGLARGVTEIWRISDRVIGPLSLAQLVSLVMLGAAAWLWVKRRQAAG